jgi:hypothetical protein
VRLHASWGPLELLYLHRRVSDGGYGPPDTSAEVVPLVMRLSEGSWRVLNLRYELIPKSGWPSKPLVGPFTALASSL